MEALKSRHSLHGYFAGFLFLAAVGKGCGCEPPSPPQCFRRRKIESSYRCEWFMNVTEGEASYDLHFDENTLRRNYKGTWDTFYKEELTNYRPVEIWVEAHVGGSSCRSNTTKVTLWETIKYEAPHNISAWWSKSELSVSWAAAESHAVVAEVWFGKHQHPIESWEKVNNRSDLYPPHCHDKRETTVNLTLPQSLYKAIVGNLSEHSAYELRLRHRSTRARNPLWSEWSPLVIVPAALHHEPNVTMTTKRFEGFRRVKLKWKPVPHGAASVGGVTYMVMDTQSSQGCPCKAMTRHLNTTSFTVYVSYSAVNISVWARNAVGDSPPATLRVPAEPLGDLEACNQTLLHTTLQRSTCLQWYEYHDGDSRPETLMTLPGREKKPKRKEIIKKVKDYVRYLYLEHSCVTGKAHTLNRCLFYQSEDVPLKEPQGLVAFRESPDSATLSWTAIPPADQRGFLTHYSLCIATISSQEEHRECKNISALFTKYRLEKLRVGVKYNISLAGATRLGEGPAATVTMNALEEKLMNVWFSLISLSLFLLVTTMGTVLWRRIQSKVFSPVPTPVILDFSNFPERPEQEIRKAEGDNGKEKEEEEVHEVTLLPLLPVEDKFVFECTEELTALQGDKDSDGDTDDGRGDSPPSEGSGDGRLSPASAHGTPRGSSTDVQHVDQLAMLLYRTGLVFDVRTDPS